MKHSLKNNQAIPKVKAAVTLKRFLIAYLFCSVVLSALILTRLTFTVDLTFRAANSVVYLLFFYFMPIMAIFYLFRKALTQKKWIDTIAYTAILASCILLLYIAVLFPNMSFPYPEHLILWVPIPLLVMSHAKTTSTSRLRKKKYATLIASGFIIAVLLPNTAALTGVNVILNQTSLINDNSEKISFIYERVNGMTAYGLMPRACNDYWEFLLSGAGNCGEMAMANANLMGAAGFDVRRLLISGENHEFIEVNVDGKWMVADASVLMTREDYATKRVRDIGSLTYVCMRTEKSFTEFTQQYVSNADTITIKITRGGQPVSNIEVTLKHAFVMKSGTLTEQLPCSERAFITNEAGEIMLHMGKPHYIGEFEQSEHFYWVFVSGKNQSRTVTSTGTGLIHSPLEIAL